MCRAVSPRIVQRTDDAETRTGLCFRTQYPRCVKAQSIPQDAKAKLAREQEELYLNLCLQAAQKPPPGPVKPADTK